MRPIKQNPGAYFVAFQTYLTIDSNPVPICNGRGKERSCLNSSHSLSSPRRRHEKKLDTVLVYAHDLADKLIILPIFDSEN